MEYKQTFIWVFRKGFFVCACVFSEELDYSMDLSKRPMRNNKVNILLFFFNFTLFFNHVLRYSCTDPVLTVCNILVIFICSQTLQIWSFIGIWHLANETFWGFNILIVTDLFVIAWHFYLLDDWEFGLYKYVFVWYLWCKEYNTCWYIWLIFFLK